MYEKLLISALLGKLLFDTSQPLSIRANVRMRLAIRYSAHEFDFDYAARMPFGFADMVGAQDLGPVVQGGLIIPGQDRTPVVDLTLKNWLRHTAAVHGKDNRPISVHQIINFVAHIEGGVHAGLPKDEVEEAFNEFNRLYYEPNLPRAFHEAGPAGALVGIGTVTLAALRPLYEAVVAAPVTPWRMNSGTE